jgi:hypothetical protein
MQFFIPPPSYQDNVKVSRPHTIQQLCALAHIPCRATGRWTSRLIDVVAGEQLRIIAEPGSWGAVRIEVPRRDFKDRFKIAINVLAYGLHDLVARESIRGTPLSVVAPARGRPRRGAPRSNRQRQRDYRERRDG